MYLNGSVGQVLGPFTAGADLLAANGPIMEIVLAKSDTEKVSLNKLGIQAPEGTLVEINDVRIKIGKTGIYELDETVAIRKLVFPNGANSSVIVDFVY